MEFWEKKKGRDTSRQLGPIPSPSLLWAQRGPLLSFSFPLRMGWAPAAAQQGAAAASPISLPPPTDTWDPASAPSPTTRLPCPRPPNAHRQHADHGLAPSHHPSPLLLCSTARQCLQRGRGGNPASAIDATLPSTDFIGAREDVEASSSADRFFFKLKHVRGRLEEKISAGGQEKISPPPPTSPAINRRHRQWRAH
jgi:hypothetical protein